MVLRPADAASGGTTTSAQEGVWVYVGGHDASDSLSISASTGQSVCSGCNVGSSAYIGSFGSGTSLQFTLTDGYCGQSWSSSDTTHARIVRMGTDLWQIGFDDGGGGPCTTPDGDFNDAIIDVSGQSASAAEKLGGGGEMQKNPDSCAGKPVDCVTGNEMEAATDLAIPGRGISLASSRTYNSLAASAKGIFGFGWVSSYGTHLEIAQSGDVTVVQDDGARSAFYSLGSGQFSAAPKVLGSLTTRANGSFVLVIRNRLTETFSAAGLLQSLIDLHGYTTSLSYSGGQLSSVTDPAGRSLNFSYNGSGLVSQLTDQPAGRTVQYGYDSNYQLTSVKDVLGHTTTYGYSSDGQHLLTSITAPRNVGATTFTYDSSGRVTQQQDPLNRITKWAYAAGSGGTTTSTVTYPSGNVMREVMTDGLPTSITTGYGTSVAATTTYKYNQSFQVSDRTDANGKNVHIDYDLQGNPTKVTDPLGRTESRTFDGLNDVTSITDGNGTTRTASYNAAGDPTAQSVQLSGSGAFQTTTLTYGDSAHPGDLTKVTNPNGNATTYGYDNVGDQTSEAQPPTNAFPSGPTTTSTYDTATGFLRSTTAPRGNLPGATAGTYTTTVITDAAGEVTEQRDPLWSSATPNQHRTTTTYDADNNVSSQTDGSNHATTYGYDADDELTSTTRPDTSVLKQGWTPDGKLASYTDGANHTTTYGYDARDELTARTDAANQTTNYTHDLNGNLTLTAQPGATCSGSTPTHGCIARAYDADNELTAVTYLDGKTPNVTNIGYDNDGRRTSSTDGTGTSAWTYDNVGRLTQSKDGAGHSTSYGYDLDNNTTAITYPDNRSIARGYDSDDNLTSVSDGSGRTTNFTSDADGNTTTTMFPTSTGETDTTSYDATDAPTGISDTQTPSGGSATTIANFGYTRDGTNRLATSTSTGVGDTNQTYTLDSLNQLTASGPSASPVKNAYDAGDNLISLGASSGNAVTMAYNSDDQPCWSTAVTVTSPSCGVTPTGATAYSYDNTGNRTSATTTTAGTVTVDTQVVGSSSSGPSTTTTSFSTTKPDVLLALVSSDGPVGQTTTVSGAGLTWTLVKRANTQTGTAEIWKASASGTLSSKTVTATQTKTNYPLQITVAALSGAAGVGATASGNKSTGAPSVTYATTAAGSLSYATGQDGTAANAHTPLSGQYMLQQHTPSGSTESSWTQRTSSVSTSPGQTLVMGDSAPTGDSWNLVAAEVVPTSTTSATSYTWDEAGNLTKVTPPSGTSDTFTYNGDGLRTAEAGATTAADVWDTADTTPQLLTDGTNDYLYDPDGQPFEQIAQTSGTPTWLHHDQLGSTRLLTNNSGTATGTYTYSAYDNSVTHSGSATTPLQYGGGYTDDTGLIYLQNRYYDPATGQFTSLDPLVDATRQSYSYTAGDPTDAIDPTGLICFSLSCLGNDLKVVGRHALSVDEGAANFLTGGGVNKLIDTISPGASCTYAHDGYYIGGEAVGLVTSIVLTAGTGAEADTAAEAADSGVDATTVVGRRGSPLKVPRGTNEPAVIGGRSYGGHALDEMQSEGFTPSVVDDAITNGQSTVGSSGRIGYYSPANNITVVTESNGKIVTVTSGTLKIR